MKSCEEFQESLPQTMKKTSKEIKINIKTQEFTYSEYSRNYIKYEWNGRGNPFHQVIFK